MSYLKLANDPMSIEEFQYATSHSVRMTKFTSCCGLLVRRADGEIFAAHLALVRPDGQSLVVADAGYNPTGLSLVGKRVLQELLADVRMHSPTEVRVVGLNTWRGVLKDVAHWIADQLVGERPACSVNTVNDGVLSARVEQGAMVVSYAPEGGPPAILAPVPAGRPTWSPGEIPLPEGEPEPGGGAGEPGADEGDHGGGDPGQPDEPGGGGEPGEVAGLRSSRD